MNTHEVNVMSGEHESYPELGCWSDRGCDCPKCGVNRANVRIIGLARRWRAAVDTLVVSEALCRRRMEYSTRLEEVAGGVAMKAVFGSLSDDDLRKLAAKLNGIADAYERLVADAEAWVSLPANRALSDQRHTLRDDLEVRTLQLDLRRRRAKRLGSWADEMEACHEAAHSSLDHFDKANDYGGCLYNPEKAAALLAEVEKAEQQYAEWGV